MIQSPSAYQPPVIVDYGLHGASKAHDSSTQPVAGEAGGDADDFAFDQFLELPLASRVRLPDEE